jgi:hypothetical protein
VPSSDQTTIRAVDDDPEHIDIDTAMLGVLREHHDALLRLQADVDSARTYSERKQRISAFLTEVRRQQAAISEVPGLEDHARRLADLREELERRLGL